MRSAVEDAVAAAYRWNPTASPRAELRRLGLAQVDRAIADVDLADRNVAVHEVRKQCKKLRALLRLVRPVAGDLSAAENRTIRDLARALSDVRDDAVALEAFETLLEEAGETLDPRAITSVREALAPSGVDGADREAALKHAREQLVALRGRIKADWTLPKGLHGTDAVLDGLGRSYARGRDAFAEARKDPTIEALHDWRKRVKDHGYHCRLLRPIWPPVLTVRAGQLGELADLLGEDHDLAMLRARLDERPDRFGDAAAVTVTSTLLERRRARLQQAAISLGRRVYAERPKALRRRVARWWDAAVIDADTDLDGPGDSG